MPTNVAMLRGVNVGARNKIKMKDLEALFVGLGHTSVVTYIQSGNVVFASRSKNVASLARGLEERIARELGVLVRTNDDLATVTRTNPFLGSSADIARLHVSFLEEKPDAARVRAVEAFDAGPDELQIAGREVFVHCPNGYGNTKLNNGFLEKKLGTRATTRNWNTVTKLLELATP